MGSFKRDVALGYKTMGGITYQDDSHSPNNGYEHNYLVFHRQDIDQAFVMSFGRRVTSWHSPDSYGGVYGTGGNNYYAPSQPWFYENTASTGGYRPIKFGGATVCDGYAGSSRRNINFSGHEIIADDDSNTQAGLRLRITDNAGTENGTEIGFFFLYCGLSSNWNSGYQNGDLEFGV
jgi:hypothetical protein